MWYLIVPPVVVVLSLAFLLWYLSRKAKDPAVTALVSDIEEGAGEKIAFSRTKTFFLRLLEKTTQRFKIISLKMHNHLNDLTQSLREKRQEMQEKAAVSEEQPEASQQEIVSETERVEMIPEIEKKSFFSRFKRRRETTVVGEEQGISTVIEEEKSSGEEMPVAERETFRKSFSDETLTAPIIRRKRQEQEVAVSRNVSDDEDRPVRPMVSETMTQPEVRRKPVARPAAGSVRNASRTTTRASREEDLIANIAANPKDFAAYEALGDYYLETNNVKDAKECYRQVLKLSPVHRMVKIKIRRLEKLLAGQRQA